MLDKLKEDKALDLATASIEMLDKYLGASAELIELKKGEVVDVDFIDDDDEEEPPLPVPVP